MRMIEIIIDRLIENKKLYASFLYLNFWRYNTFRKNSNEIGYYVGTDSSQIFLQFDQRIR